MKKIIAIVVCLMMVVGLVGCGDMFDTNSECKYAIIKLPNGEVVEGEIEWYANYNYEQLKIRYKGGNTYLISSTNAVLMTDVPKTEMR